MKKVLIADDERSLRLLVSATLEGDGIEILEAPDGIQALQLAQAQHPDLILLDVQMPEVSGFEVCEQLKANAETAAIPVVMLTAQSQPSARERGQQVGVDAYLTKPFSPLQLLRLVENLLQRAADEQGSDCPTGAVG